MSGATVGAESHSRKRLKISRDDAHHRPRKVSPLATTSAQALGGETHTPAAEPVHREPCQHEAALTMLHTDVGAMRDLVTCQVCHRFMYEPYALSCGHTYCYSCLSQWLGANRKKTCPDCRAVIHQQPTPSYVIRELVLIFVGRSQLLPDGETSEEHVIMAKEEAEVVAKDKANADERTGGLFKGIFRRGNGHLVPIHDPGDNVDRCPDCHWEVEDGYCNNCGQPVGDGFSDFDGQSVTTNSDLDRDLEAHDGAGVFGVEGLRFGNFMDGDMSDYDDDDDDDVDPILDIALGGPVAIGMRLRHGRRTRSPINITSDMSEDESDDDDDEHDLDLDGFIDDDEHPIDSESHTGTYDSDDTALPVTANRNHQRRRAHVVISDNEEEDAAEAGAITIDDSEDEEPRAGISQRNNRSRLARTAATSSDEESEESEESDSESDNDEDEERQDHEPDSVSGFSPLQERGSSPLGEGDDEGRSTFYGGSEAPSSTAGDYGHYDNGVAGESDDDESDELDDGWGMRANHPIANTHDPRHRLQTGMQHRSRHSAAPLPAYMQQSPTAAARPSGMLRNAELRRSLRRTLPTVHTARDPTDTARPGAAHPFNLSNVLNRVNSTMPYQQRAFHNRAIPSAYSSQSSAGGNGGVHVRSYSSGSAASSDSSQTIGESISANANGKRPRQPAAMRQPQYRGRAHP